MTPLLYSISELAHIPVLYSAAAVQHLISILLMTLSPGLLRQGFVIFVAAIDIPFSVLIAIRSHVALVLNSRRCRNRWRSLGPCAIQLSPEHCSFRRPNQYTFTMLFLAALFVASPRPEGRLFALYALTLVFPAFERTGAG